MFIYADKNVLFKTLCAFVLDVFADSGFRFSPITTGYPKFKSG
jgi:hypothetical protein